MPIKENLIKTSECPYCLGYGEVSVFKPLLILESAINNSIVKDLLILNKYKFIKKVNDNFILKSES